MTEREQIAAIAEECNWKPTTDGGVCWDAEGKPIVTPPNYPHDLNAMHEAWVLRFTDGNERVRFSCELADVVAREWRLDASDPRLTLEGIIENATPKQRCEAFLRTVGKWKD